MDDIFFGCLSGRFLWACILSMHGAVAMHFAAEGWTQVSFKGR